MGCDIHSVAQVRKKGVWVTVGERLNDDRNYDTFGLLANVRNGSGFAGVDTGDGWIPISEPKGLPDDFQIDDNERHGATGELDEDGYDDSGVWMGDHSHSFLTLQEMLDYKHWNKGTYKRAFVSESDYLQLRGTQEEPESYCGGISGRNIVTMPAKEYDRLERMKALPKGKEIHVHYQWGKTYKDNAVYTDIIPTLKEIAKEHGVGPEDVRLVFGFDS